MPGIVGDLRHARPASAEAVAALHASEIIIHAGDVGDPQILERLRAIAPTFAVRGNVDTSAWAQALPLTEVVEVGNLQIYVLHNLCRSRRRSEGGRICRGHFRSHASSAGRRYETTCCF